MIFLSYEFVVFAALFYLLYYFIRLPSLRLFAIVAASLLFQGLFGGWASFIPISILTLLTFLAGRSGNRSAIAAAIALCAATLAFYKYTFFVTDSVIGGIHPQTGADLHALLKQFVPAVIPLGISFFVFEFVHYLVDVRSGTKPISKPSEFMAFALFWPTMVAGPIKRYQQFVPSLGAGLQGPSGNDAMIGLCRIAVGCAKKWAADNLTAWIEYTQNSFAELPIEARWLLLAGISFRILLDFSGYSDMAIGYARMMGIVVPENFNWPYLARSPAEFWGRWHMSLSSWIRDYIYIPLGGNRLGIPRRVLNALVAMTLCGLWHGASWNFAIWGLYHGAGLVISHLLQRVQRRIFAGTADGYSPEEAFLGRSLRLHRDGVLQTAVDCVTWAATMLFVSIGWLLFFYPVDTAWKMMRLLFVGSLP